MTTSVALSPIAILQFFDNTGKPCVGGSLLTQSGGVNYATYSEPTGTTALPNPIPLNSRGEVSTAAGASSELFLQTGVAYTFTLKDSAGNQLWSIGNITSGGSGNIAVSFPTASGSANAQIVTNAVPISLGLGTTQWFLPVAANTGATTINVDNSGAKNAFFLTKALVGGELQIGVPAQIIYDGTQWNLVQSAKGPAADYYVDSGLVNAMVVTGNAAQTTFAPGMRIKVLAGHTNTIINSILNFNGFGNFIIMLSDGATVAQPGQIIAGLIYEFVANIGTTWTIINPSRVTGSFTGTLATGFTTTPTGTINYNILQDGKTVQVYCTAGFTATSNAASWTVTGAPSAIQSANAKFMSVSRFTDVGGGLVGTFSGTNTSTWAALGGAAMSSSAYTASGTKGISSSWFATYSLD